MTDDEFLKLCRVAPKTQQMKVLLMTTTLVEYKRRRQNAPTTADSVETQTVKPEPAPLVVIPTPVEPVEEKPLDTLEILPTDDDATKKRKLEETLRRRRRELGIKGYED